MNTGETKVNHIRLLVSELTPEDMAELAGLVAAQRAFNHPLKGGKTRRTNVLGELNQNILSKLEELQVAFKAVEGYTRAIPDNEYEE